MITSDRKAVEVQARYAQSHAGLAPAVRRYLNRLYPGVKDEYIVCGPHYADLREALSLPIGRKRVRPSITPSNEPAYKIELRRWLVNHRKQVA